MSRARSSGPDDLHRPPRYGGEAGPERLVPGEQFTEGLPEGRDVDGAPEPQGLVDVVCGASLLQLVKEPQPVLVQRQGRRAGLVPSRNDLHKGRFLRLPGPLGKELPLCRRKAGEPRAQVVHSRGPVHPVAPGEHLCGRQAMLAFPADPGARTRLIRSSPRVFPYRPASARPRPRRGLRSRPGASPARLAPTQLALIR